ncbi:MAG: 50S ribosomal protein L13 [Patescibacteria group bacterium]|nr:50S ribosomal protein L13 [Patescibacteria group bacterium]
MKVTKSTKLSEIERKWHLFDAKGKALGRLASQIAQALMGKQKPNFVRHLDCGDYIVVINADQFVVTGKKEKEKLYSNYSGYPGGLKQKALWQIRKEKPSEPIRHAVYGMLPKNKLRDRLMSRLFIYAGSDHPYKDKFQKQSE